VSKTRTVEIDPGSVERFEKLRTGEKRVVLVQLGVMTKHEYIVGVRRCEGCGGLFVVIAEEKKEPRLDNAVLARDVRRGVTP
jgi:hypothetical protein